VTPIGPASPRQPVASQIAEPVRQAFKREQALFSRHRYTQAMALLSDLLARPDLTPRQRFEALCRKAECLEHLKQPRLAVELLREVTRSNPNEPLGFSLLGEYLYRIHEDCRGALKALNRALALSPKDPDTLWWQGQVYQMGQADLDRARRTYMAALETDAAYAAAMESLAVLCEAEGKWIEAIDWRKMHYKRTHQPTDLVQLADLYLRLGNTAAAQKYARTAVHRAPAAPAAWLALAKALAAGRKGKRAVDALERYARLAHPKAGPFLYSRDFVFLESIIDRADVQRLLPKLPTQP